MKFKLNLHAYYLGYGEPGWKLSEYRMNSSGFHFVREIDVEVDLPAEFPIAGIIDSIDKSIQGLRVKLEEDIKPFVEAKQKLLAIGYMPSEATRQTPYRNDENANPDDDIPF